MTARKAEGVPPEKRRRPKGAVARKAEVTLTADALSAVEHLMADMRKQPAGEHPPHLSGAVCTALEEAAARRGWVKPKPEK